MCSESRKEKMRLYYSERTAWLKERGMCTKCGSEPARPGKALCWRCAMDLSDRRKVFYEHRVENNLCWKCGKPTKGTIICPECRSKESEYKKRLYAERKANHQCPRCGRQLPEGYELVQCEWCRIKSVNATLQSRRNRSAA